MSFAALRVSEPTVVSTESTSRRLLSPTLTFSFSYFRFLHVVSPYKKKKGLLLFPSATLYY